MKNPVLLLMAALLMLAGCTTQKKLRQFSKSQIIFGSGGGFTGETNEYSLRYNGMISKINHLTKETKQLSMISKGKSKSLFRQFLKEGLDTLNYSEPGNRFHFIGFKNDTTIRKIVWSDGSAPPAGVKEMYENLILLINQ